MSPDASRGVRQNDAVAVADRPLRADARRNREAVVAAARTLFAAVGRDVQMEEIAASAGVGVGTVYRHFPTKTALLSTMVSEGFATMTRIAADLERSDPGPSALFTALRQQVDAIAPDRGFQLAAMGWDALDWPTIDKVRTELQAVMRRLIERAARAGLVRADLDVDDLAMLMCGVTAIMYFKGEHDWRRYLEITLDGLRPPSPRRPVR